MRPCVQRSQPWNDPYPAADVESNVLYAAFTDRPKHLDPAQSYTEDEITFTAQIYEPPLQYHYLKRPYELIPGTLEQVPQPRFFDAQGREVPADAPVDAIAESVYELRLGPGMRYQPHPAFALDATGQALYLGKGIADGRQTVGDFPQTGSRELTADDYIYQMKRLAHPRLHSPIFGMMSGRIVGLKELGAVLQEGARELAANEWLDLRSLALAMKIIGATMLDWCGVAAHRNGGLAGAI